MTIPEEAVTRAADAITIAANHFEAGETESSALRFARAALEAAAPMLADEIARKILAHMEEHIADPAKVRLTRVNEVGNRAARRHFRTAAQIAGLAFCAEEDMKRLAAEGGDYVRCDIPEVPGEH